MTRHTSHRDVETNRLGRQHAWVALLLLIATVLTAPGCRAAEGREAPNEPLAVSTQTSTVATPSATATLISTATPTPTSTTQVPPTASPPDPTSASRTGPTVGAVAPSLVLEDLKGDVVDLRDLQGKVVLLNFWTTW